MPLESTPGGLRFAAHLRPAPPRDEAPPAHGVNRQILLCSHPMQEDWAMTGKFLFAAALAAFAAPAGGAVMVIGNTSARICYEGAEARASPAWDSIGNCDRALAEEALADADRVATYVNRGI